MAQQGKRVLVLDADLGLANVDVMLGLRVRKNLSHVLDGTADLRDILVEGLADPNSATSGTRTMVELTEREHASLIQAFSEKGDFDGLIVDTAAGIGTTVRFGAGIPDVIVVVCDEPMSITDAYALMKVLSRDQGVFKFKVANMVRNLRDGQVLFNKLTKVTDRFLDVAIELSILFRLMKICGWLPVQKAMVMAHPEITRIVGDKSAGEEGPGLANPCPSRWAHGIFP